MTYIVFQSPPEFHQISLEEFLFGDDKIENECKFKDRTATRTYEVKNTKKYGKMINVYHLIEVLRKFNERTEELHRVDRHSLYYTFYIPKKSGGLRKIDAPERELMSALRELKDIFETEFSGMRQYMGYNHRTLALYHTAAFAYIKERSTIDSVRKHQQNESRWFAKFDFSNFFGSIGIDFVMKMFGEIFPFSEVIADPVGCEEMRKALDLAFLDGVLPQGTPISPLITNVVMIPIDYRLCNDFRDFKWRNRKGEERENKCVYTRYADDILISSKYIFNHKKVEEHIINVLKAYNAPFVLNKEKTRFGSRSGHNFNLGIVLNSENEITIGWREKKNLRAMMSAYAMDKKNGISWQMNDIRILEGKRNYWVMVEGEEAKKYVEYLSNKLGVNIEQEIKNDLTAA